MRVAGLTMHAENGKRLAMRAGIVRSGLRSSGLHALTPYVGARLLPQRHRARHAKLGLRDVGVFGAVAVKVQRKIGLYRDANVGADIIFELEPQRRWFCRLRGNDVQRQNDVVAITDRIATGAIGKSLGRRPQHVHRFDVFGTREVEAWRRSGIAWVAPIGLPSRIESDLDARPQKNGVLVFARRARDQSRGAMGLAVPV